ncbi:hypothetical protein V2I01_16295 [Micromonospora sp. BRA006-A]|nr:hypothetical protein [Micromonospora sp. BRA006-A]
MLAGVGSVDLIQGPGSEADLVEDGAVEDGEAGFVQLDHISHGQDQE